MHELNTIVTNAHIKLKSATYKAILKSRIIEIYPTNKREELRDEAEEARALMYESLLEYDKAVSDYNKYLEETKNKRESTKDYVNSWSSGKRLVEIFFRSYDRAN